MRIARPYHLELEYTREMLFGLLLKEKIKQPRKLLHVGLGTGSIAKFFYRHFPHSRNTIVEINPQIEWVAHQYFKLPDSSARLHVITEDAADFIGREDTPFDYIVLDGFDPQANSGRLNTSSFYQACRYRLAEEGVLAVNFLGRQGGAAQQLTWLQDVFEGHVLALPPSESGNIIAFAHLAPTITVSLGQLQSHVDSVLKAYDLNLFPTLKRLQKGLPNLSWLRM